MRGKKAQIAKYVFGDILSTGFAWSTFFYYRKSVIEAQRFGFKPKIQFDEYFFWSLSMIIAFWLILYLVTGTYTNVMRKSRLLEFSQTLLISLIGVIVIFFALILDDTILSYKTYYQSFAVLFGLHLGITGVIRFLITTQNSIKIRKGKLVFNTLLIGNSQNAVELINDTKQSVKKFGEHFVGYVKVLKKTEDLIGKELPCLGEYDEVKGIIEEYQVEDVIIAIESSEHGKLEGILSRLDGTSATVKVIPDMYDILSGSVRMSTIFGTPLIEIKRQLMPTWQMVTKRLIDVCSALLALTILSPVYIVTFIMVKMSSPGPVFFMQQRVGLNGRAFNIIKFRSMFVDAEKNGPALSSDDDPRITKWGKVMRKYRLDELPQFFNVLKGEMSLVGPRPERQFYIEKISERASHYKHLLKVRPGITSWGMVKYGYAENVDEMIKRMKFDLLYIENMSLLTDFKILIYTVLIVLQGRGK